MRIRSVLSFAIHQFFQNKGFYYSTYTNHHRSDAEGAGEMFRVSF